MLMKENWSGLVDSELNRRWFDKPRAALMQLYNERRETGRRQHVRGVSWLGVFIYVGFGYVDFVLVPDIAPQLLATRIILGLIGLLILEGMIRFCVRAATLEIVAAVNIVEFYIACLYLSITSSHSDALSYYMMFSIIYMLVATVFFNFRPTLSLAVGLAFLLIVVGVTVFSATFLRVPPSFEFCFAFTSLYGSCFAFGAHANWRLNTERYNVFLNALQAELRQCEVLEQAEELLRLSNTDDLTALQNRRSIDTKLCELWDHYQATNAGFAVILLDIDFFKSYNDGYGHQEGDRCLFLVAKAIESAARTFGGSTGRYGGEEFIILACVDRPGVVAGMAETIRSAVEPSRWDEHRYCQRRGDGHPAEWSVKARSYRNGGRSSPLRRQRKRSRLR